MLFYGQARFVDNEQVINTYKNTILSQYDTDCFCHMWFKDGGEYDCSSWAHMNNCNIIKNAPDIVLKNYNPIVLQIDEPKNFTLPPNAQQFVDKHFTGKTPQWNNKNYSNIMSQLYSIKLVSTIFKKYIEETNVNYDWIVLARYDSILKNFPNLHTCDKNLFYLPNHHPRFPDTIHAYGIKFLDWGLNIFDDVDTIDENIWEPSPEAFKMHSFLKKYNHNDLCPYPMDSQHVRS